MLLRQKTLTFVDARNLKDKRYTIHDIFNQQIQLQILSLEIKPTYIKMKIK
ncbi:Putative GTPase (G3E family) [Moritella viscosa]|uniref:GTPase (G3E family) n=1 Tax=Moritella viscosa TaxID=80854 RepID=A0A1L0D5S5_9GAMM|nr:Putative GTPase (G3E family) [Moritella viscosa]SGY81769.1 Putative GTPase (G3E family) [Moritella viscosa]SGY81770.1 Putative GTPase (G3E family) [Moritella viscosa]SGY81814.1 Putative GTPase (G3E family) [Moritella viscosa]SGY81938.1 Putative GTPase (G3E family) [Moritella viscosa]